MKAVKKFEEFIQSRVVKVQSPDEARAEFLVKDAEKNYNYLKELIEKIGVREDNANDFVNRCHDLLMQLVRANMLLKGYNASGIGSHEAEVSYMRNLGFSEVEVQFADQIRYFRNGILYYGSSLDKTYAEKVITFTKKIYPKLLAGLSKE